MRKRKREGRPGFNTTNTGPRDNKCDRETNRDGLRSFLYWKSPIFWVPRFPGPRRLPVVSDNQEDRPSSSWPRNVAHRGGNCRQFGRSDCSRRFLRRILRPLRPYRIVAHRQPNVDLSYPCHHCIHHSRFASRNPGCRHCCQKDQGSPSFVCATLRGYSPAITLNWHIG